MIRHINRPELRDVDEESSYGIFCDLCGEEIVGYGCAVWGEDDRLMFCHSDESRHPSVRDLPWEPIEKVLVWLKNNFDRPHVKGRPG